MQMQFNYYHYGMGTSQSPTTPETVSDLYFLRSELDVNFFGLEKHAKRKRRKVDPGYREKMEKSKAMATLPTPATVTANPDSTSSTLPVLSNSNTQEQPQQT